MILYNVTSSLDPEVEQEWVAFLREVHLPNVMATGLFVRNQLCHLLNEEEGGVTYAAQYFCNSTGQLEEFQEQFELALEADLTTRFPGQYVSFRTVLEIIE